MLRLSALVTPLALAAALATPVAAGKQSVADTITVTGTAMDREQARAVSRALPRAVMGTPISGQNARWTAPLCIAVSGVQPTTAVPVLERMEAIATRAGARLGKPGCSPNVVLHFSADADADFAGIERQQPALLGGTQTADRQKLRTPGQPVRWFYGSKVEGLGGRQIDTNPRQRPLAELPELREGGLSLITIPVQVNITSVIVLVDVPRVAGVSLTALADYVAFAVLSRTRMDIAPGSGSIMALFEPTEGSRPEAITAPDMAFLKALYTIPINRVAAVHRGNLAEEMMKDLAKPVP